MLSLTTKFGTLSKTVSQAGAGFTTPNELSTCSYYINCDSSIPWCENEFDPSSLTGKQETTLGNVTTLFDSVVHTALETMKEGEIAHIEVCLPWGDNRTNAEEVTCHKHDGDHINKSQTNASSEVFRIVDDEGEKHKDILDCSTQCSPAEYQTLASNESCEHNQNGFGLLKQACTYTFNIHLVSFEQVKDVWELTSEEKLTRAEIHKSRGTELYQKGCTTLAFCRFGDALRYCISVDVDLCDDALQERCLKLKCQCYSNLSACQVSVKNYSSVITNCTKALKIDPKNIKCLYRRGQAHFTVDDPAESYKDLTAALQIEPNNKAVLKLLTQVNAALKKCDKPVADVMSKMFM